MLVHHLFDSISLKLYFYLKDLKSLCWSIFVMQEVELFWSVDEHTWLELNCSVLFNITFKLNALNCNIIIKIYI